MKTLRIKALRTMVWMRSEKGQRVVSYVGALYSVLAFSCAALLIVGMCMSY